MNVQNIIATELFRKVSGALAHANTPMSSRRQITQEVVRELTPMVQHATNTEPWFQSRVTIGALISIGTGMLALFGIVLTPEDTALIIGVATSVGTAIGGAITLYGRWKAKKPLGS